MLKSACAELLYVAMATSNTTSKPDPDGVDTSLPVKSIP